MYEPACMGHGQTHTPKALTTRVRVGTKTVHLMREPLLEADSGGSENYSLQVVSRRAQHAPAGKGGGWECSETGLPSLVLHQGDDQATSPVTALLWQAENPSSAEVRVEGGTRWGVP